MTDRLKRGLGWFLAGVCLVVGAVVLTGRMLLGIGPEEPW
jgi:hypothetical protein